MRTDTVIYSFATFALDIVSIIILVHLMKLPPELITIVEEGWQREIVFLKKDAKKVFDLLYPDSIKFDYKKKLNRIKGKEVRLIGWGD